MSDFNIEGWDFPDTTHEHVRWLRGQTIQVHRASNHGTYYCISHPGIKDPLASSILDEIADRYEKLEQLVKHARDNRGRYCPKCTDVYGNYVGSVNQWHGQHLPENCPKLKEVGL